MCCHGIAHGVAISHNQNGFVFEEHIIFAFKWPNGTVCHQ